MLDSNWRQFIAVGLGLALFAVAYVLVNEPGEADYYEDASKEHPHRSLQDVPAARVPIIGTGQPFPRYPETKWKEWQEQQDLKAQRQMAHWAKYAGIAALFSIFVAAVGVVLVKQTLDTNREALKQTLDVNRAAIDVAKESSQRSLRAYVLFNAGKVIISENPPEYRAELCITNEGVAPAWNLTHSIDSKVDVRSLTRDDFIFASPKRSESLDLSPKRKLPHRKLVRTLTPAELADLKSGAKCIWVWGRIYYRDVYQLWAEHLFRAVTEGPFSGEPLPLRIVWMVAMEEIPKELAAKERAESRRGDWQEDDDPQST